MMMMTWYLFPADRCQNGIEVVVSRVGRVEGGDVVVALTVAHLVGGTCERLNVRKCEIVRGCECGNSRRM